MADLFGPQGNALLPIHRMDLFFPSPDAFKNQYNLTEKSIEELGKIEYFVKCKTAVGKINPEPYSIKSCVYPGPDLTSPIINPISTPLNNAPIKYGTEEQDVTFFTNEPSEYRWDVEEKDYDKMENQLDCEIDVMQYELFGLPCDTTLPLENNTRFYIKCKDQPWLAGTENESKRNIMEESFVYNLAISKEPLVIDELIPRNGEIITKGFEPISTTLKLVTSGGVENGKAICSYQYGTDYTVALFETNASKHEQKDFHVMSGDHTITYFCEDLAGNIATNTTSFKFKLDSFGPKITRVYYDSGLKITTNEPGECRQDSSRKFIFENATLMYSSDDLEHFGTWELKDYYIQCKDDYGNKGPQLKIKPYQI